MVTLGESDEGTIPEAASLFFTAQDLGAVASSSIALWRTSGALLRAVSRPTTSKGVDLVGVSGKIARFHPTEEPNLGERPLEDHSLSRDEAEVE